MRHLTAFLDRQFRCTDVHSAIQLHRISVDDLATDSDCEVDGEVTLAGGSRADHGEDRRRGHRPQSLRCRRYAMHQRLTRSSVCIAHTMTRAYQGKKGPELPACHSPGHAARHSEETSRWTTKRRTRTSATRSPKESTRPATTSTRRPAASTETRSTPPKTRGMSSSTR